MAETLTESFCERCGTRYEFKAPTRLNPLRKTRGLVGGLRNYLTSQDALSDAIGDAMRSEEDGLASAQLEAFHESFNFCIDCRQYTCVNCWNDDAGRCRSCAPIPGTDDLAERLAASFAAPAGPPPVLTGNELQRQLGLEAWPTSDLPIGAGSNGHGPESWPEAEFPTEPAYADAAPEPHLGEFVSEPEPEPMVAEVTPEPEPVVAEVVPRSEPEPVVAAWPPEPEPVVAAWPPEAELVAADIGPEPVFVEPEPRPVAAADATPTELEPPRVAAEIEIEPVRLPLRVVAWDEDAAFELVATEASPFLEADVEPQPVAAEVADEPEPVAAEIAAEPVPEPVAAVAPELEPEPMSAAVQPLPEPQAADFEPEFEPPMRLAPISDTILHFPTRPVGPTDADDERAAARVVEAPNVAARRAQLDMLGLGDPGEGPVGPERPQPLPYRSRGAGVTQAELARAAALRGSFWEASAREVAGAGAQVGVQACGQCGLSLSANARFCRRCGTRQAQSA